MSACNCNCLCFFWKHNEISCKSICANGFAASCAASWWRRLCSPGEEIAESFPEVRRVTPPVLPENRLYRDQPQIPYWRTQRERRTSTRLDIKFGASGTSLEMKVHIRAHRLNIFLQREEQSAKHLVMMTSHFFTPIKKTRCVRQWEKVRRTDVCSIYFVKSLQINVDTTNQGSRYQ